jgi:hypothetical protein
MRAIDAVLKSIREDPKLHEALRLARRKAWKASKATLDKVLQQAQDMIDNAPFEMERLQRQKKAQDESWALASRSVAHIYGKRKRLRWLHIEPIQLGSKVYRHRTQGRYRLLGAWAPWA